jgi:molybdenum cofactor cytidylyltransferase
LLQHVVDAASAGGLDELVVVLGHEADRVARALRLPSGARLVTNPEYRRGQSTSLRAGLAALDPRSEAALVLLGDQPGMPAELVRRAVAAFRTSGAPVVRTFFASVPGHPVVVARSEWDALGAVTGDAGGRGLWDSSGRVARLEVDAPPLLDVDTWEQYQSLLADRPQTMS